MCKLSDLRKQIDEIDEQLAALLKRRFSVAKQIGEYKKANGIVVTDGGRESAVYEHIGGLFDDDLQKNEAKKVYMQIIASSKELQK